MDGVGEEERSPNALTSGVSKSQTAGAAASMAAGKGVVGSTVNLVDP